MAKKKKTPTIQAVTPLDGYRIQLEFSSGSMLELNMENRLQTIRYYPLMDRQVFFSAGTDGSKIVFDTRPKFELDIFAREAMDMALKPPCGDAAILCVQPMGAGRLQLHLQSKSILLLNMEGWIHKAARYQPLMDAERFGAVSTEGKTLRFGDGLQIDAAELTDLALVVPEGDDYITCASK